MKQNTHLLAHVAISAARGATSSRPSSAPRRRRARANAPPSRRTSRTRRSSPAWNWKSIASRSGWPLIARIWSPATSPAAAAGVPARTTATTTPLASTAPGLSQERALTGPLPLLVVRGVEEPHALNEILEARDDREERGEPERDARRQARRDVGGEQPAEDREDLQEGRRLARPRRPRVDAAAQHIDERRAQGQDDVAADH